MWNYGKKLWGNNFKISFKIHGPINGCVISVYVRVRIYFKWGHTFDLHTGDA